MSTEVEISLNIPETVRDLIRSLPVRSAYGLPVDVAASPAVPFSTSLEMTKDRLRHLSFCHAFRDQLEYGHGDNRDNQERSLHREGRSGANRRRRKQVPGR